MFLEIVTDQGAVTQTTTTTTTKNTLISLSRGNQPTYFLSSSSLMTERCQIRVPTEP